MILEIKMFINPKWYSQHLDPFVDTTKAFVENPSKHLKWSLKPESILDLGIGDGKMTKVVILPLIPINIKEYIGGDISEKMLSSAKATISHEKFKTLRIDATTKNLPNELKNRFDHIFSYNLFHHTQDLR